MTAAVYEIPPRAALCGSGAQEVGNKAWNLMRMASAGLPVPPAFVLSTEWCRARRAGELDPEGLAHALDSGISTLESVTGLAFGSSRRPLLVSVRSGAPVSMPGMLETVLDIGLNETTVEGLIRLTGNPRLAWDSYRRLVQGFSEIVQALPPGPFDEVLRRAMSDAQVVAENELDHMALRRVTREMLELFNDLAGVPFPQEPRKQLSRATTAVLSSWDAPKAVSYRSLNRIEDNAGTAVLVQAMVFGNAGGASGSGVAFTRNPVTGEHELFLDFRFNGQGEDVVSGRGITHDRDRLRRTLPCVWKQLEQMAEALETLFCDAQEFEFTLHSGTLSLLQSRDGQRTPWAALHIAVDLVEKRLISPARALTRLAGIDLRSVRRTRRAAHAGDVPLARGLVASMGIATGRIALDCAMAARMARNGTPIILVRQQTATSDIEGLANAAGILTASGDPTSHAAVVARQLDKVCVVGCTDLAINLKARVCQIGCQTLNEGDVISLDGNEGEVFAGRLETIVEEPERALAAIAAWQQRATA